MLIGTRRVSPMSTNVGRCLTTGAMSHVGRPARSRKSIVGSLFVSWASSAARAVSVPTMPGPHSAIRSQPTSHNAPPPWMQHKPPRLSIGVWGALGKCERSKDNGGRIGGAALARRERATTESPGQGGRPPSRLWPVVAPPGRNRCANAALRTCSKLCGREPLS